MNRGHDIAHRVAGFGTLTERPVAGEIRHLADAPICWINGVVLFECELVVESPTGRRADETISRSDVIGTGVGNASLGTKGRLPVWLVDILSKDEDVTLAIPEPYGGRYEWIARPRSADDFPDGSEVLFSVPDPVVLVPAPVEPPSEAELNEEDAERFRWFFGASDKTYECIGEWLVGVRERWTVDEWRSWCDDWVEFEKDGPKIARRMA